MRDLLRSLARLVLPGPAFARVGAWYRAYRLRTRPRLSEAAFRAVVADRLGVGPGDVLFIHSSLSELFIDFSPAKVVRILREVVGPEGTLLFPASPFRIRAEDYLAGDPVFDVRNTPTAMGFLPEYVRWQADARRSLHPTNSVVAVGRHAEALTEAHHLDVYPCGERSPYYGIVPHGGKIVGLGIEPHYCLSFVHAVEDVMKGDFPLETLKERVYRCRVIDEWGEARVVETLVPHERIRHRNLKAFFARHLSDEELRTVRVRGSVFFVADARRLFDRMEALARQGVTIYTRRAFEA